MRTLEIQGPVEGQLPTRPSALTKIDVVETHDSTAAELLANGKTIVIGGLSLLGESGSFVFIVGIIKVNTDNTESPYLKGWSLNLGHPDEKFRKLCYFDTEQNIEDVCLPFPNCMLYFACETDPALAEENADADVLKQIAYFVLPFISDDGPPKGIDW